MAQIEPLDLRSLEKIIEEHASDGRSQLLPTLFEAQRMYGHLSEPIMDVIGRGLRVPLAEIHGVVEFYTMLYSEPVGGSMVRVCTSPVCAQTGGHEALNAACQHLGVETEKPTTDGRYMIEEAPCLGLCDHAPAALVDEVPVAKISVEKPRDWIVSPQAAPLGEIGGDPRWLTGRCGELDPKDLAGFESRGSFAGLKRALIKMRPEDVVDEIKASGLVGRGGAAFPTGLKWEYTAAAANQPRYVVCNADESEPGTFKDRVLMEGDPYFIIEGMILAGYAIGSEKGFIYIRGEYPRAQKIMVRALREARKAGYLGENINDSGFSFDIEIRSGAGAYICGEETALFESIEGKRGFPRLKPPFPTTHGLFGQPTVINNVETLCAAAWIIAHGADAYRSVGTEKSPGSKLFCLSGDIARPGVYEVPFGTRMSDLLQLAGGIQGDLQAILLGGAAGAFAGPGQIDLPMSFEGLQEAGLPLGSGVVMVINKERDIRETLLSLAQFFAHESCGKCFPCQLGTQRQLDIVARVAQRRSDKADVLALQDVRFAMTYASICGLGMTAGTAILSAMERWPELFVNGERK